MKKALFIGIFVFSLVLNVATVATLGWHLWAEKRSRVFGIMGDPRMPRQDMKHIYRLWPDQARSSMMGLRKQIRAKRSEVLDAIASDPGNVRAAEKSIRELAALRDQMERQALAGISQVMANLPLEKREAFLAYLKSRSPLGPGMGHGKHFWKHQRKGAPPCQTPDTTETQAPPRNRP